MENELKKMKLMMEKGAQFMEPDSGDKIDPFIESEFLKNMEMFEEGIQNAVQISVYDFIQKPDYALVGKIPDSKIGEELTRIMEILNDNGINLDTLCEVDDRELYRFITEELFVQEIDDMRIEGMMTCFTYEEFHPNHEYDIRNTCYDGIESYLRKDGMFMDHSFTTEALQDPLFISFREAFESFVLNELTINEIRFNTEKATADYTVDFTGVIEGSREEQHYKGNGSVELIYQYGYWYIQKVMLPETDTKL